MLTGPRVAPRPPVGRALAAAVAIVAVTGGCGSVGLNGSDLAASDPASRPSRGELASSAMPRIPPQPGLGGRLAFDNLLEIFVLDLATGEITQLTETPGPDQNPVWSPDGRRIAFRTRRDGNDEIYLMDADGSNEVNLTRTDDRDEWGPTWSPDGEWLAFNTSVAERTSLRLYVVRPDGTDGHFLGKSFAEFPAWSPDGRRIAFASMRPGQAGINPDYDLRVIDVDGTRERRLTSTSAVMEMFPQWSPDGSRIAFMAGPVGMSVIAVWVMDADGQALERLTKASGAVPSWSPDGRHIVYVEVGRDVVVINADGTDPVELGLSALEFAELGFVSWTR
jgi:TolB protein